MNGGRRPASGGPQSRTATAAPASLWVSANPFGQIASTGQITNATYSHHFNDQTQQESTECQTRKDARRTGIARVGGAIG
jgi:hypothetical protein